MCGCILKYDIHNGKRRMTVHICREGCLTVAGMLQEADRQGKPVTMEME